MTSLIRSFYHYRHAYSYIKSAGGLRYFVYSGAIGIGIFLLMIMLAKTYYHKLSGLILTSISIDNSLVHSITDVVSGVFMAFLFLVLFKYVVLICTAPLMSRLSVDLEIHFGTKTVKKASLFSDLVRSLRITIRNMCRELLLTILVLLISLVPILGWIVSSSILLIQGYYAGFGNYDLWAERHYSYQATIEFMRSNKIRVTSNGLVFLLILAIPLIGAIIAPPLATAASTVHAMESEGSMAEFV